MIFYKFKIIRPLGRESYGGILTLKDVLEEQINLKIILINFKNLQNHKTQKNRLLKGRQKVLNSFESKTFLIVKQTQGKVQLLNLVK